MDHSSDGITYYFSYSPWQLRALDAITYTGSAISLATSMATAVFYTYLLVRHRQEADRVSLRCVAFASITNIIQSILDIAQATVASTKLNACRAFGIISEFVDVLYSASLAVIGVNLIVVFVLKLKHAGLFTRVYLPVIIIFSLLSTIAPIYDEVTSPVKLRPGTTCWYYNHVGDRLYGSSSWLNYYGFILFTVVVGLVSSIIALGKIIRDKTITQRTLRQYSNRFHPYNDYNPGEFQGLARRDSGTLFTKIVVRCTIYPLVPLIVYIWGFVIQLLIQTKKQVPFAYAAVAALLVSLNGFFMTAIFFSEPTVGYRIRGMLLDLRRMYVEEFSVIDSYIQGDQVIHRDRRRSSSISNEHSKNTYKSSGRLQPRPATTYSDRVSKGIAKHDTDNRLRVPRPEAPATTDGSENMQPSSASDEPLNGSVPMRKVAVESPAHRLSVDQVARADLGDTADTIISISDSSDEVYIPYRYPLFANFMHWLMTHIYGSQDNSTVDRREESSSTVTTSLPTSSSSPDPDESPEIVIDTPSHGSLSSKQDNRSHSCA